MRDMSRTTWAFVILCLVFVLSLVWINHIATKAEHAANQARKLQAQFQRLAFKQGVIIRGGGSTTCERDHAIHNVLVDLILLMQNTNPTQTVAHNSLSATLANDLNSSDCIQPK